MARNENFDPDQAKIIEEEDAKSNDNIKGLRK